MQTLPHPVMQLHNEGGELPNMSFNAIEVIERMKSDLDYFAALVCPETYEFPLSPMHHSIWILLLEAIATKQRITRHAIGIPRGFIKTHLLKLLIVYIILFTDIKFILVVGNTTGLARTIIEDALNMLRSDNVVALFGDYQDGIEKDNAEKRVFIYRGRRIILKPMGAMNSVRGTNEDNTRPEVILCDDMQDKEGAKSVDISKSLQAWFSGTLLKARSYKRCHIIYVGNMYPDVEISPKGAEHKVYTCILRNLDKNVNWISWVTGAIQADGSSVWPALHPVEALLEDLEEDTKLGQRAVWFAEVQNDPEAGAGEWFDSLKVTYYEALQGQDPIGRFIMIDPSLGKKKSDAQMVGLFGIYDETGIVCEELRQMQCTGPQLVQDVLAWALETNTPLICSEAYGYQESLLHWFAFICEQNSIDSITLAPITRPSQAGGKTKNLAIHSSFQLLYSGYIKMAPHAGALYIAQAQSWDLLDEHNVDDVLDVVEYGPRVYHQFRDFCIIKNRTYTADYAARELATTEEDDYVPAATDFRDFT